LRLFPEKVLFTAILEDAGGEGGMAVRFDHDRLASASVEP
jgi:hypothetical protein